MQGYKLSLILTTLYLLIYTTLPQLDFAYQIILLAFVFSPFMVIWMVLSVLIQGKAGDKSFSEGYWYDDVEKQFSKNA